MRSQTLVAWTLDDTYEDGLDVNTKYNEDGTPQHKALDLLDQAALRGARVPVRRPGQRQRRAAKPCHQGFVVLTEADCCCSLPPTQQPLRSPVTIITSPPPFCQANKTPASCTRTVSLLHSDTIPCCPELSELAAAHLLWTDRNPDTKLEGLFRPQLSKMSQERMATVQLPDQAGQARQAAC